MKAKSKQSETHNNSSDVDQKMNSRTRWQILRPFVITGIGILVLISMAVWYAFDLFPDNKEKRITFITTNFLSIFALAVIIMQAIIYYRQWKAMQEQREIEQWQLDAFMLSDRAYLTIKRLRMLNRPLEAEKMPVISFEIVNGGKTPARRVSCANRTKMSHDPMSIEIEQEMLDGIQERLNVAYIVGGDNAPGIVNPARIPNADFIREWSREHAHYFLLTQLSYTDIQRNRYTIPFWFEYLKSVNDGAWVLRKVGAEKVQKEAHDNPDQAN